VVGGAPLAVRAGKDPRLGPLAHLLVVVVGEAVDGLLSHLQPGELQPGKTNGVTVRPLHGMAHLLEKAARAAVVAVAVLVANAAAGVVLPPALAL